MEKEVSFSSQNYEVYYDRVRMNKLYEEENKIFDLFHKKLRDISEKIFSIKNVENVKSFVRSRLTSFEIEYIIRKFIKGNKNLSMDKKIELISVLIEEVKFKIELEENYKNNIKSNIYRSFIFQHAVS